MSPCTVFSDDSSSNVLATRWNSCDRAAIERDLAAGITIITDRYAFSGIAFSAAKVYSEGARTCSKIFTRAQAEPVTKQGLPFDWLLSPDLSLPSPDLTLYLTLPPDQASIRSDYGQERYESLSIQSKVREQFKLVADRVKRDEVVNGRWLEVDAGGTREVVAGRIWEVVEKVLEGERKEVGRLWTDSRAREVSISVIND